MWQTIQELLSRFTLNPWKIVGLTGGLLFGLRWFFQAWHSKKTGSSIVPMSFWVISIAGSAMQLAYFVGYRFDSVGFVATFPPTLVSIYNLVNFYKKKPAAPAVEKSSDA